ncbi:putative arylsulfatase-activating protein [Escherichia coli]|nr:putative arylsulfatase-activating protein [Escherichia coli]
MHVTAKPSSFQCNLKCDYCFYLEKESQFTHEKWMDDSTLKEFIKQYIAASGNQVYFTWQGGEPTLAGLDFFRKVIHYQQRYAGQKRIFNALQTNGILLNNEWCAFLKEHEFLVGISIDGPQELHDRYRRSNSGNGTFAKVIAAIERLKSYQVEFNTLTVINNVNVHYPLEVYHFLKSIGSKHMQFIELLETGTPNIDFSGHSENTFRIIDFSVPPTAYGKFMSTILCNGLKTMWVKFSSVSLKALSAVFWGMGIPVVFSRSPARIIWLLKVMETFTNATILSIHSTKLETLINLNSKR